MKTKKLIINNIVLFSFVFLISGISFGQNNLQKAKQMVAEDEYQKAITFYNEYFQSNTPAIDDARNLAQCYMMVNDTKSATEWMSKVVQNKYAKASDKRIYANLLKSQGLYDEAIAQFMAYKAMVPSEGQKVDKWIEDCKEVKDWITNPGFFEVVNEKVFNTSYSELALIPFEREYLLTSDRKIEGKSYSQAELSKATGNPYYKMYLVKTDKNFKILKEIKSLEVINNEYHNGPGVYDKDNKTLYFTRTKMIKTAKAINPDPTNWFDLSKPSEYVNRLEIYSATYNRGTWSDVKPFAYNKPDEYSVGHPALSPDGKILYFSSDMPGGLGGTDIFFCEKAADGSWSNPVNCGSTINTEGKEVFPYVDEGGTLFFSSNGHTGLGGLDIFKSKGSKEKWETPENLKFPLNSPNDDFSIVYTETSKTGFIASNREGGLGSDDIYSFEENEPKDVVLAITTLNKMDNDSMDVLDDVDITVVNKSNNKSKKYSTDENGIVYITVNANTQFEIKGKKGDYLSTMQTVETKVKTQHDTIRVELAFDRLVLDKPILIKNIYYDFDKWAIRPDATIELDKLIVTLNQNPKIQIELGSHTDSRGGEAYNQFLSQKRAESAITYIISRGINPKRLTAKGYGESVLVNGCKDGVNCTEAEHQMNRRTEFKVTAVKKVGKNKKNNVEVFPNEETRPKFYTVEQDDTLYRIALMYNTTVDKLKELNSLKDNIIVVGQKLTIY